MDNKILKLFLNNKHELTHLHKFDIEDSLKTFKKLPNKKNQKYGWYRDLEKKKKNRK